MSWDAYPSGTTNSNCRKHKYSGGNFCPDADSAPDQFSDVNLTNIAVKTISETAAAGLKTGKPWFVLDVTISFSQSLTTANVGITSTTHCHTRTTAYDFCAGLSP